jgi:hypothetical protein
LALVGLERFNSRIGSTHYDRTLPVAVAAIGGMPFNARS